MEKLDKFFITALVAGLGLFTSALALPIEPAQALIGTNQIENNAITTQKIKDGEVKTPDLATAAVTKEKLNPSAVKLVVIQREGNAIQVQPHESEIGNVQCNPDEEITGGGFSLGASGLVVINSGQAGHGWRVTFSNPQDGPISALPLAECAHLELGP